MTLFVTGPLHDNHLTNQPEISSELELGIPSKAYALMEETNEIRKI